MSTAAARIPLELWSKVLSFTLEPHEPATPLNVCAAARQPTLIAAIRVNSVFFLAGVPHLYHAPSVRQNLASFFLGIESSPDLDTGFKDTELLKEGRTKQLAFRHIRHLRFLPLENLGWTVGPNEHPDADQIANRHLEQIAAHAVLEEKVARTSYQPRPMPLLQDLQLPDSWSAEFRGILVPHRPPLARLHSLSRIIVAALRPRILCDRTGNALKAGDERLKECLTGYHVRYDPELTISHDEPRLLLLSLLGRHNRLIKSCPPDLDLQEHERVLGGTSARSFATTHRPASWLAPGTRKRRDLFEATSVQFFGPRRSWPDESNDTQAPHRLSRAVAEASTDRLRMTIISAAQNRLGEQSHPDDSEIRAADAKDLAEVMSIESSDGSAPCPACRTWE